MKDQFQHLFINPFTKNCINFNSERWIVFVDGLDECRGEVEQRKIIDLICNSLLHHTVSTPFVWIIASRPEAHLKTRFSKVRTQIGVFWELEVPIDSDDSQRDVEHYLHTQFLSMRESSPDSIPPLWPSETDFSKISKVSSGLFVFASTLVAYLLGGNPVLRFKRIMSLINATAIEAAEPKHNPLLMLDLLYTQIMSGIPEEVLSTTNLLLGFFLLNFDLPNDYPNRALLQVSNILGLGQHETYTALEKLHSVLDCPPSQRAVFRPVQFLHTSFSDFLLDSSRSRTYSFDLNAEATQLWQRCTEILRQYTIHHSMSFLSPSTLSDKRRSVHSRQSFVVT